MRFYTGAISHSITRRLSRVTPRIPYQGAHLIWGSPSSTSAECQLSYELIKMTLSGLRYLVTYDRTLIRTITTSHLHWLDRFQCCIYSSTFQVLASTSRQALHPGKFRSRGCWSSAGSCGLFVMQGLP